MDLSSIHRRTSEITIRGDCLWRCWCVFAVAVASGIVCFICGLVLGVYLSVVPIFSMDPVSFPHASLWLRSLSGLTVAVALVLGWLTNRVMSRAGRVSRTPNQ